MTSLIKEPNNESKLSLGNVISLGNKLWLLLMVTEVCISIFLLSQVTMKRSDGEFSIDRAQLCEQKPEPSLKQVSSYLFLVRWYFSRFVAAELPKTWGQWPTMKKCTLWSNGNSFLELERIFKPGPILSFLNMWSLLDKSFGLFRACSEALKILSPFHSAFHLSAAVHAMKAW